MGIRFLVKMAVITGCTISSVGLAYGEGYSLRLVHVFEATMDEAFVRRARSAGSTHVVSEFNLAGYTSDFDAETGAYLGHGDSTGGRLFKKLIAQFRLAESHGLRLIPEFQTGSMHSAHWAHVNRNILYVDPGRPVPFVDATCVDLGLQQCYTPVFAYNEALDSTFARVMRIVAQAFQNARLRFRHPQAYRYIDYVHIGHDEPATDKRQVGLAPGKSRSGARWIWENVKAHGNVIRKESSIEGGYEYSSGQGGICTEGVVALMAHELQRRVTQIHTTDGMENAKVLLYADAWDPQHNGRLFGTSRLLSYPFVDSVREALVLVPWCYGIRFTRPGLGITKGWVYDEHISFTTLSENGYNFVVCFSLASGIDGEISSERRMRFDRNWHAMKAVPGSGKCLGFMAAAWARWDATDPPKGFNTMEMLHAKQSGSQEH